MLHFCFKFSRHYFSCFVYFAVLTVNYMRYVSTAHCLPSHYCKTIIIKRLGINKALRNHLFTLFIKIPLSESIAFLFTEIAITVA